MNERIDPAHDRRRLVLYFGGLAAFYLAVIVVARPQWDGGEEALDKVAVGVMFAPTVGALLATVFGPGVIRLGKLSWWILAGFLPGLSVLVVTLAAAAAGAVDLHSANLGPVLVAFVPISLMGMLSPLGEEVGWRGFLWPLLRRRSSFVASSAVLFLVWFGYHAPLTIAGIYGTVSGLPAFAVALTGFVLFVGVLTERSRSIWPSVLAHSSWNMFVATRFSSKDGGVENQAFTGSDALLGEFGWLAAFTMLALGATAAMWHVRTPTRDGLSPRLAMGYGSESQAHAFRMDARAPTAVQTAGQ